MKKEGKLMSWQDLNLTWHYVEKWAAEKPAAEALVYEKERLTWSDFRKKMDMAASAYMEIGIDKGDRIASGSRHVSSADETARVLQYPLQQPALSGFLRRFRAENHARSAFGNM